MAEKNASNELLARVSLAKAAALEMALLSDEKRRKALEKCADALREAKDLIAKANLEDLRRSEAEGVGGAILQRLKFDEHKIRDAVAGIESLMLLSDPLGKILLATELAPGLELYRVAVPIGLIGVVFEARPDALVQIAALCLKSGNAVILKGGSEARQSNRILYELLSDAGQVAGLPEGWITLIEAREDVSALLALDVYVDLLIPRGSNAFVQHIMANTKIPVLGHADGVCHTYIDGECDQEEALRVVLDAKTQYVSVCNATETILIDEALWEGDFLDLLMKALEDKGVSVQGDASLAKRFNLPAVQDWHTEYLDLAVSIKMVSDLEAAIAHINRYGSGHTDAILTRSRKKAERFMAAVDSGNVFWNCSTRFSDGFRYGFGAEVGVSTSKIHARGPVGLEGLLTYKYKLFGHGDRVGDFASGERKFTHKDLGTGALT